MSSKLKNIDQYSENELVEGCLKDDRKFQELLYKRFAPKMYGVCKNYAESRDEAMDFLQEGFISVFANLHRYRFEGSLEGWIRRIIVRRAIESIRKKKRYLEVINDANHPIHTEAEEYEIPNVKVGAEKVRELVKTLPEKAALVLKLYVLEGYTHAEISEITGVSIGTSKSQLNRARKLLKEALLNTNG